MRAPDVTVVSTTYGFWNDMLAKSFQFKNKYFKVKKIGNNELVVCSDNSKDMLEEILNLSKEYPTHEFLVKTDSEDHSYNFVKLYKCKNGVSKLISEGYEYYYSIAVKNNHKYDEKELEEFTKKLGEFFNRLDTINPNNINIEIPHNVSINEEKANIEGLTYEVTYTTKETGFKATRQGLTYIGIDIWPLHPSF